MRMCLMPRPLIEVPPILAGLRILKRLDVARLVHSGLNQQVIENVKTGEANAKRPQLAAPSTPSAPSQHVLQAVDAQLLERYEKRFTA